MTIEFHAFGRPLVDKGLANLPQEVIDVEVALKLHPAFEIVEMRYHDELGGGRHILVVDCQLDEVPTKNRIGILYQERIAISVGGSDEQPHVYALRKDFPKTTHLTHISNTHPSVICLYLQDWATVLRFWTPQSFLARILWWFRETALETIHPMDQPVEQMFFMAAHELVFPAGYNRDKIAGDEVLAVRNVLQSDGKLRTIRCEVIKRAQLRKAKDGGAEPYFTCLEVSSPSVVHGGVECFPATLGQLSDFFLEKDIDLKSLIGAEIESIVLSPIRKIENEFVVVIVHVPISRLGGEVEKIQRVAILLKCSLAELGEKTGALHELDGEYLAVTIFGEPQDVTEWKELRIDHLEVKDALTPEFAQRASGIASDAGQKGVLAGVGSLGSGLFNIWSREGWGEWTLIDHDFLKPHNLARHTGYDFQVGVYKVDAVLHLCRAIYSDESFSANAIVGKVNDFTNQDVVSAVEGASFVVDATTSLDAPRELARMDNSPRVASVFVTPSGNGAVLLAEDKGRDSRIDCLEAQYYRAILRNEWGKDHLSGHRGELLVGVGCREATAVIPYDHLQLFSATLAGRLRTIVDRDDAVMQVWHCGENGSLHTETIDVSESRVEDADRWSIAYDTDLLSEISGYRVGNLPNETGGILYGYVDHKSRTIYVVDAAQAPADSLTTETSFIRGERGVLKEIREVRDKTANIVTYIGEWHSHPKGFSARPSMTDFNLLGELALGLFMDGAPALMLIVSDRDWTWSIGEFQVE